MFLVIFFSIIASVYCGFANLEGPYALTLTPTKIWASRQNLTGHTELLSLPASLEWRSFYKLRVQHYPYPLPKPHYYHAYTFSNAITHRAIAPMISLLRTEYNYTSDVSLELVPSVFHASLEAFARPGHFGICSLHNFMECKHLNRRQTRCDEYGEDNFVLYLEYEKEYLIARMMHVDFEEGWCREAYEEFCKECGEDNAEILGKNVYEEMLSDWMFHFIRRVWSFRLEDWPEKRFGEDNIRAVVTLGEASHESIMDVRQMARRSIQNNWVTIVQDLDASEVMAYSAAELAYTTEQWFLNNVISFKDA